MSGPLQLIPPGLLGLFQLKSLGRNPRDLREDVQPILDLTEWYMQAVMLDSTTYFPGAAALSTAAVGSGSTGFKSMRDGTGATIVVPSDETWWVDSYTVQAQVENVGTSFMAIVPAYQTGQTGQATFTNKGNQSLLGSGNGGVNTLVQGNAERFWLPPGATLGVTVLANNSVAPIPTVNGYLRFARLPV